MKWIPIKERLPESDLIVLFDRGEHSPTYGSVRDDNDGEGPYLVVYTEDDEDFEDLVLCEKWLDETPAPGGGDWPPETERAKMRTALISDHYGQRGGIAVIMQKYAKWIKEYESPSPHSKEAETTGNFYADKEITIVNTSDSPLTITLPQIGHSQAEVNKLVDAIEKLEEWNRHYPAGKIYQYDQAKTMETQLTVCINNCIAAKEALTNYKK